MRALIRGFKVVLWVEIGWLVLANLFLNTAIGPWAMNGKPETFSLHWESAWTPYPARIYAREVVANIHTWTMDVELHADRANTSVHLLPLLTKHLIIDGIQAGTVDMTLARKAPDGERPTPDKAAPGFLIELRDMEIQKIDRLVFNQIQVNGGKSHARGSASFRVRGEVKFSDIVASWKNANILLGDAEIAKSLSVDFSGGLDAFYPKQDKGLTLLKKFSALINIAGFTDSLVPLKIFFPDVAWIERIDGEGDVDVRLDIENGKLLPGSIIDIAATGLELDFLGFRATGSGRIDADVSEINDQRIGEINLVFDHFGLQRKGDTDTLVTGQGLLLQAKSTELELVKPLNGLELLLEIPESKVPDITFLTSRLPEAMGISVKGGKAQLNGRLQVSGNDKEARGEFRLFGENLTGNFRNMDFEMDLELNSQLSGRQLDDFRVELEGTKFKLFNGSFDNEFVEVDKLWWMTVSVPNGYANLAEPLALEAEVDMSMKDTRAVIALFAEVKDWIRHFDGILTVNDVEGKARVSAADQHLSIRELELAGDRLELMAELQLSEEKNSGIFWGKLGILSFGLERIGEETDWKMINGRRWYEKKRAGNWSD